MKQIVHTSSAPAPIGPYSQAVKAGGFLFCSGMIAIDPATGALKSGEVAQETEQIMQNIGALLQAAGLGYGDIVKTSIFLKDMGQFTTVNEIYGRYFTSDFPARETVEVARLPKDVNVEISVTALLK